MKIGNWPKFDNLQRGLFALEALYVGLSLESKDYFRFAGESPNAWKSNTATSNMGTSYILEWFVPMVLVILQKNLDLAASFSTTRQHLSRSSVSQPQSRRLLLL